MRAEFRLPSRTIDVDLVLRERRTLWTPVVVLLLYWGLHQLIHPLGWAWSLMMAAASMVAVSAEYGLYPAWISIGRGGIAYGQWFRRRRYSWGEIDSFALGNPGRPEVAYVLVSTKAAAAPHAVRLPRLSSHPPQQLVAVLREKQRIFSQREHQP